MNIFIFFILIIFVSLYFAILVSFEDFNKLNLLGFIEENKLNKLINFKIIEKYEIVIFSLKSFVFVLQILLIFFSYEYIFSFETNELKKIVWIILSFSIYFYLILYSFSLIFKESIIKKLSSFIFLPWTLFYPLTLFFKKTYSKNNSKNGEDSKESVSEKEIDLFFEESKKQGVFEDEDKELLESVIEFGDTLVKEIMTPRVDMIYVNKDVSIEELIHTIRQTKKSRYPVISDRIDNIDGIILSKDVFDYWIDSKKDFNIKDLLRKPFFVPETMRILELLKEMQKDKQKFAIVVDEFGGVSGVVTMEDIVEEIVGEIKDEYDDDSQQIIKVKDYYVVKGDTDIFELEEFLKIKTDEEEDFQTIAGLLSYKAGKIPKVGDKIEFMGYIFEILETKRNRILKVKIKKIK